MTRYEQGFITKCAEYGVDPEWLTKVAAEFKPKDMQRVGRTAQYLWNRVFRNSIAKGMSKAEAARAAGVATDRMLSNAKTSQKGVKDFRDLATRMFQSGKTTGAGQKLLGGGVGRDMVFKGYGTGGTQLVRNGFGREAEGFSNAVRNAVPRTAGAVVPATRRLLPSTKAVNGNLIDRVGNSALAYAGEKPIVGEAVRRAVTEGAQTAGPAANTVSGKPGSMLSWLRGRLNRYFELMGGGNQNAREYKNLLRTGARNERDLAAALSEAVRTGDTTGFAHMTQVGDRMRGFQSAAENARRLQGAENELGKVLAARLGTAGAVGVGGLGVAGLANSGNTGYRSSDPRHSLDYWNY